MIDIVVWRKAGSKLMIGLARAIAVWILSWKECQYVGLVCLCHSYTTPRSFCGCGNENKWIIKFFCEAGSEVLRKKVYDAKVVCPLPNMWKRSRICDKSRPYCFPNHLTTAHESAKKSYSGERSRKLLQKIATLVVCVEKTVFNVLRLHIDCDICYIRVMFGKDKQLCVCVTVCHHETFWCHAF